MPIKRGLTLGKYAPLHKGHQLVILLFMAINGLISWLKKAKMQDC